MADQVQWGPLVQKLLKKKGNEGLELSTLVKKAVKAAHAQHQDLHKKALQRALESFLDRGHGFIVQDGRVLQPSNQQLPKRKGADVLTSPALSDGLAAAAEALAELGSQPGPSSHAGKKPKAGAKARREEEQQEQQPAAGKALPKKQGAKQQHQQQQEEQQQAAAGKAASKKRGAQEQHDERAMDAAGSAQPEAEQQAAGARSKKPRRQAAELQQEQQQEQPDEQQEPAQQQKQQHGNKVGKKRKQAEGAAAAEQSAPQRGAAAAAAAAAGGDAEQQEDEGEEERPRQKRQRAKKGQAAAAAGESTPQEAGGTAAATPTTGTAPVLGYEVDLKRWRESNKRSDVKSGPFSEAEKETIRQAVILFAEQHGHSTEDFDWLFDRTKKRAKRSESVWGIIAEALPNRTYKAVWTAGMRMFHPGNYQGRFTAADDTRLRQLVAEHGTKWKVIGPALGRMPASCKDRWKEIKLGGERRVGPWSEEETQKLEQAVHEYLAIKKAHQTPGAAAAAGAAAASGGGGGGGGGGGAELPLFGPEGGGAGGSPGGGSSIRRHVLDDIDWGVISGKVGTRSDVQCLEKWYDQLCPSMVDRGEWGPGDDRRLLRAVFESGAAQDYELEWGELVPQRTAVQARRRWRLMLKCVPNSRNMDFPEAVNYLVGQYMPQLKQQGEQQGEQQQQQPEGGDEGATPGQ